MKKLKKNKWYSFNTKPDKTTYGIIGQTDMGYLCELCYEDGVWKEAYWENYKVYFKPMETGFFRWKIVS